MVTESPRISDVIVLLIIRPVNSLSGVTARDNVTMRAGHPRGR